MNTEEKYQLNKQNEQKTEENYSSLYIAIKGYFDELKVMIETEQESCLTKIKEQFSASDAKFKEKNIFYN